MGTAPSRQNLSSSPASGRTRAPEPPRTWALLLGLTLLTLVPRAALFPFNENVYGDAVIRVELSERWLEAPGWISSFADGAFQFGPAHLYAIGGALWAWPDRDLAPRAVSLVFGTLTVLPLFFLTRRLFGVRAATVAALAFAPWGMHLQFSTTAASEGFSLFWVVAGLALFARAREEGAWTPLWLSAALMNVACATRYDAWMLVPLLAASLLFSKERTGLRLRRALAYGAACSVFPLVWLVGNAVDLGDPLYPVRFIDAYHRAWWGEGAGTFTSTGYRLQNLFFWPGVALVTLTPIVAMAGMAGAWLAFRQHPSSRWLVALLLVPTLYFTVRSTLLGTFVPLARFAALQVMLLLPFVAFGFERGLESVVARRRLAALGAAMALLVPVGLAGYTYRGDGKLQTSLRPVSSVTTNPESWMRVARFLEARAADSKEVVLLDSDGDYGDLQVAFYSRLPEQQLLRVRWGKLAHRLEHGLPRYLVLFDDGQLAKTELLEQAPGALRLNGARYSPVPGFDAAVSVFRREG